MTPKNIRKIFMTENIKNFEPPPPPPKKKKWATKPTHENIRVTPLGEWMTFVIR